MQHAFLNEYAVLYVFCIGVVCQSLLLLRSSKDILKAAVLTILCALPAWYIPESADKSFAAPLIWATFYVIFFSIIFRKSMLPKVTALILVCHTALFYYVLYLLLENSEVVMPRSMIITGLAPGVLVILLSLSGMLKHRKVKIFCYVWYLFALSIMIGHQWFPENLASLYAAKGFSAELFIYVFLGGGVFLFFISHIVQLALLVPLPGRASHGIVFDAIIGPITYQKEHADLMTDQFVERGINSRGWLVVIAYPAFLYANASLGLVPHGIVVNLSILIYFWFFRPKQIGKA
jgi:hypothetical protein